MYPSKTRWRGYEGQRGHVAVSRRPIYVRAPVIRQRYFDIRYRPQVVVENYAPVSGYYWVNGRWDWNGVEWRWTAGHYEPNPTYADPNYAHPTYLDPSYPAGGPSCEHDRY